MSRVVIIICATISFFRNIKRVIFYELIKFSGEEKQELSPMQVRQIGGRAGRYGKQSKGEVTTYVALTVGGASFIACLSVQV